MVSAKMVELKREGSAKVGSVNGGVDLREDSQIFSPSYD